MFVVLVVVQAVIFNHVVLYGMAMPFVFIYFIVKLPVNMAAARVIFLSFLIGTVMDCFQDTPGLCGLACTCLGAIRRPMLRLLIPRDDDIIHTAPSIRTFGLGVFTRYVMAMSLIFCALAYTIEAFAFFGITTLLLRIGASTLLTALLLIATDSLSRSSVSEKRL